MELVERMRARVALGMAALLVFNAVIIHARLLLRDTGFDLMTCLVTVAISGSALFAVLSGKTSPVARIVSSLALAAQAAILVYAFSGSSLQIDFHMYFFALLAIAAAWLDWRAIVANASLVAVHHLTFYVVAPLAVFPGVSDFTRVIVHALILVLQAAVLILLCERLATALQASEEATSRAQDAEGVARDMVSRMQESDRDIQEKREQFDAERNREAQEVATVVAALQGALAEMAQGNLAHRIHTAFPGSFDEIRQSFNRSADTLESVLGQVASVSSVIRGGTDAIRDAAAELKDRTGRQAHAAEASAQSLDDVTKRVVETRQYAEQVGKTVSHARGVAERSEAVVTSAVEAMEKISGSSNAISQIISVIDNIAFQTNLLALNAGVEAARAGEAGKGFAVVAQEVRELAQRCAKAAHEINELISQSAALVGNGVKLVDETGKALHEIAGEVNGISAVVEKIVAGTREQSGTLSNVTSAVNEIDRETQQNERVVDKTFTGIAMLANEVASLDDVMRQFRISAQGQAARRAA